MNLVPGMTSRIKLEIAIRANGKWASHYMGQFGFNHYGIHDIMSQSDRVNKIN